MRPPITNGCFAKDLKIWAVLRQRAIRLGSLDEAVELLDVGRSVFWQQTSSLRSDLELLMEEQPELATELESVGRKLDVETFSSLPSAAKDGSGIGSNDTEDVGKERRRLVVTWEGLLDRVRQLSKFEYFLKPVPFCQLRQAVNTTGCYYQCQRIRS